MASRTAMENLLQEAGYTRRQAVRLSDLLDEAALPGMGSDDLYTAIVMWRDRSAVQQENFRNFPTDPVIRKGVKLTFRSVCASVVETSKAQMKLFEEVLDSKDEEIPPGYFIHARYCK